MSTRLRQIRPEDARDLRTALTVLADRSPDVANEIRADLAAYQSHIEAVSEFKQRMTWGNALPEHPTDVLSWLLEHGWTPPPGVYLLEDDQAAVIQDLIDDLDQLTDPPAGDPS